MDLTTGKLDIDYVLQQKLGISLVQAEELFGDSGKAHTEIKTNDVLGAEPFVDCNKEAIKVMHQYLILNILQPNFEQIMRIRDPELLIKILQAYDS